MTLQNNRWMLVIILVLAAFASAVTFSKRLPGIGSTRTRYGLDIQGGMRLVLQADTAEYEKQGKHWSSTDLDSVRRILERRVNATGATEPVIVNKPPDQVIVELPGLKNADEARTEIESTASLQFYLLPELGSRDENRPRKWTIRENDDPVTHTKQEQLYDLATNQPVTPAELDAEVFSRPPIVTGKDLLPNSQAVPQPPSNQPVIEFEFNDAGSQVFKDVTRANIGRYLAIFLDKKLLTAPTINSVIPGRGIIEGGFTLESAKQLSDLLNAGALPVPLHQVQIDKVEATLGAEAVRATAVAGAVGLGLVLVFMLVYYWALPGLVANVALVLYAIFSMALFKLIPVTLTLPGIAGFILSIGMAVDANILIFERFKEEVHNGKALKPAIDAGFKRALTAIIDSNACTMITCLVLYNLGTGPIRGFALTLGLGVAVSMFTAITVTRTFLFTLVNVLGFQNPKLFGTHFHWVPDLKVMLRKWVWLGLSGVVIIPGLIAWGMGGIHRGIDFQGGTELRVPFASRHTAGEIERAVAAVSPRLKDTRAIVSSGAGPEGHLAYVTTPSLNDADRTAVIDALTTKVGPLAAGNQIGYSTVSGTISSELTTRAIWAVVLASGFIVFYLSIRFAIGGWLEGLKYGICAVIALLHDVAVLWGAFAILGYLLNWQIDSLFVTAMLTVIGFSVHDTIIVFDRIRENLHNPLRGETYTALADRSIDQTVARSVNTSFTVVMTLVALLLFGGGQVRQFAAALTIGIISGTYSSIFNASVLLVMWKERDAARGGRSTLAVAGVGGATVSAPRAAPRPQPAPASGPSEADEERVRRQGVAPKAPRGKRRRM